MSCGRMFRQRIMARYWLITPSHSHAFVVQEFKGLAYGRCGRCRKPCSCAPCEYGNNLVYFVQMNVLEVAAYLGFAVVLVDFPTFVVEASSVWTRSVFFPANAAPDSRSWEKRHSKAQSSPMMKTNQACKCHVEVASRHLEAKVACADHGHVENKLPRCIGGDRGRPLYPRVDSISLHLVLVRELSCPYIGTTESGKPACSRESGEKNQTPPHFPADHSIVACARPSSAGEKLPDAARCSSYTAAGF